LGIAILASLIGADGSVESVIKGVIKGVVKGAKMRTGLDWTGRNVNERRGDI